MGYKEQVLFVSALLSIHLLSGSDYLVVGTWRDRKL